MQIPTWVSPLLVVANIHSHPGCSARTGLYLDDATMRGISAQLSTSCRSYGYSVPYTIPYAYLSRGLGLRYKYRHMYGTEYRLKIRCGYTNLQIPVRSTRHELSSTSKLEGNVDIWWGMEDANRKSPIH
ncbi:hypothetical protein B0T24DRAFT_619668 [Lasiosphaeria ovina]|uniref:Uncharacterized protein n=1 Tax=Lasiosphaeria ovina TaxID=92902 RepID=A0AAE0NAZ8_9PEZI|nr:hypothetical protein B0T24DRAFT_619668 [Lasiosphaeria ovina]